MTTLILVALIIAAILAVISVAEARGRSLLAWAVLLIAAVLLLPSLPL